MVAVFEESNWKTETFLFPELAGVLATDSTDMHTNMVLFSQR